MKIELSESEIIEAAALVAALLLAISAESDDQFERAVVLAEDFASSLGGDEVERAKSEVQTLVEVDE